MTNAPRIDSTTQHRLAQREAGRAVLVVIIALAVVVAVTAAVFAVRASSRSPSDVLTRDRFPVDIASFDIVVTSSGELKAANQIELRNETEREAAITFIIPEGTTVEPDTVLVELNTEQLNRELETEEMQLESAKSDLVAAEEALAIQINENESAIRRSELSLTLAELELEQWRKGTHVARLKELNLRVETTERDYERLERKYKQAEDLYKQDFISRDEKEQDEIRYLEAENARDTAALNLAIYEEYEHPKEEKSKTSAVTEAKAELDRVLARNRSELAQREANLKNRQRQLKTREDRVAKLDSQLEACTIKAPDAGLVVYGTSVDRNRWWGGGDGPFQVGSRVYPQQTLIVLPDTRSMIAEVKVHESITSRIHPGQHATIVVEAVGGGTFDATVESIGVLAESGGWRDPNLREYTVKLKLDEVNGSNLKPSMRCEARILLDTVQDARAVPIQAVFNDAGTPYCYIADGSHYARRSVRTGRFSETWIEIMDGLDQGDIVLLREPDPGNIKRTRADDETEASAVEPAGRKGRRHSPPPQESGVQAEGQHEADAADAADAADVVVTDTPGSPSG